MRDAGYEVSSFERSEPPKVIAHRFRVREFEPDRRAGLESALREDLESADKVAIDSLGRATVVVRNDAAGARESISASLRKRGLAAEDFQVTTWPKLDAAYVVSVSGMSDVPATRKVADALAEVAKVVAVHVYQDAGTATLWLKEPCDALEANVRAALTSAGFTLARFERSAD